MALTGSAADGKRRDLDYESRAVFFELKKPLFNGAVEETLAEQKKIIQGVKRHIKRELKEQSLSGEFCFASKKTPDTEHCFLAYATTRAINILKKDMRNIKAIEHAHVSAYPLVKNLEI